MAMTTDILGIGRDGIGGGMANRGPKLSGEFIGGNKPSVSGGSALRRPLAASKPPARQKKRTDKLPPDSGGTPMAGDEQDAMAAKAPKTRGVKLSPELGGTPMATPPQDALAPKRVKSDVAVNPKAKKAVAVRMPKNLSETGRIPKGMRGPGM